MITTFSYTLWMLKIKIKISKILFLTRHPWSKKNRLKCEYIYFIIQYWNMNDRMCVILWNIFIMWYILILLKLNMFYCKWHILRNLHCAGRYLEQAKHDYSWVSLQIILLIWSNGNIWIAPNFISRWCSLWVTGFSKKNSIKKAIYALQQITRNIILRILHKNQDNGFPK